MLAEAVSTAAGSAAVVADPPAFVPAISERSHFRLPMQVSGWGAESSSEPDMDEFKEETVDAPEPDHVCGAAAASSSSAVAPSRRRSAWDAPSSPSSEADGQLADVVVTSEVRMDAVPTDVACTEDSKANDEKRSCSPRPITLLLVQPEMQIGIEPWFEPLLGLTSDLRRNAGSATRPMTMSLLQF